LINLIKNAKKGDFMKNSRRKLLASVVAGVALSSASPLLAAEKEKCFGVSKAGKNDCQTKTTSCPGTAKKDGQKDAFVLVPAGLCTKLVGGSLTQS
jgi:uncharacterized membrane protein